MFFVNIVDFMPANTQSEQNQCFFLNQGYIMMTSFMHLYQAIPKMNPNRLFTG